MRKNIFPYSAVALSLTLAGMCWALPVQAEDGGMPSAATAAAQEKTAEDEEGVRVTNIEEDAADENAIDGPEASALPGSFEFNFKNEGDYVIEPDSMAYHNFATFIYNDFAHFVRHDPRLLLACKGNTETVDMSQKVNEYCADEADLADVAKSVFNRIVGLDKGLPGSDINDGELPTIQLLGINNNILYKRVKAWSGKSFDAYRSEYMQPYRVGEFRFTKKFRANVRERRGNSLRGWTKKMSLADLSLCAASTPIAIFMDNDEKRTRNRNAWMPTLKDDFMYYTSRHCFPYVGFLDYKLTFFDENGAEIELGSGKKLPAKNCKVVCSWDKLTLFELDDIIKADRN
ncbi:hypothetical protein IJT17_05975 [bacterium]|nr:hypothetical protein [bacterium]